MNAEWFVVIIAALGAVGTCFTMVFLAGKMQGALERRLVDIERRLVDIERMLERARLFRGDKNLGAPRGV
jgi:F0F1-type ATP synthase membrane subunit b/b'